MSGQWKFLKSPHPPKQKEYIHWTALVVAAAQFSAIITHSYQMKQCGKCKDIRTSQCEWLWMSRFLKTSLRGDGQFPHFSNTSSTKQTLCAQWEQQIDLMLRLKQSINGSRKFWAAGWDYDVNGKAEGKGERMCVCRGDTPPPHPPSVRKGVTMWNTLNPA